MIFIGPISASLDLLSYLARHGGDTRLLVAGSYRPSEAEGNQALQRALLEWTRLRVLTTISVTPLPPAGIATLAESYLPGDADPALTNLLHSQSEGNPFFAEELITGWLEDGTLSQVAGRWSLINGYRSLTLPPTILAAVRQRLTRLPTELVESLRMAAIVGRTFDSEFLAEVLGQDAEVVEELMRDAVRTGLLRSDEPGIFTFSHDKIRECLYSDVSASRRKRLHGFIGHALEMRPEPFAPLKGKLSAQRLAELAFHFANSGDRERGASYSQQAATQAMYAYAPVEAAAHFRTALSLTDLYSPTRGALLLGLGEASISADDQAQAVDAFREAQTCCTSGGDLVSAAKAAHGLGRAWWRLEQLPRALEALQHAQALLGDRIIPETVQVLVDLASFLAVSLHRQSEGVSLAERALDIARTLGDDRLKASAGRTLGNMLVRGNKIEEGLALLEESLALASRADDLAEASECCACMATGYFWSSQIGLAKETLRKQMEFAERSKEAFQLRHVYAWLASAEAILGNLEEANRLLLIAQASVENLASPEPRAFVKFCAAYSAYFAGRYEEAGGWPRKQWTFSARWGRMRWFGTLACKAPATWHLATPEKH